MSLRIETYFELHNLKCGKVSNQKHCNAQLQVHYTPGVPNLFVTATRIAN